MSKKLSPYDAAFERLTTATHYVITEPRVNNGEAFIVDYDNYVHRYQLNPGLENLFEGALIDCENYCRDLINPEIIYVDRNDYEVFSFSSGYFGI